jgi:hypothetical protein
MVQAAIEAKTVKFKKFKTYVRDRVRSERKALVSIEESGITAAVERCRMLARQINDDLSRRSPKQFKIALLAEFQVSLERAASVLSEQSAITQVTACSGAKLDDVRAKQGGAPSHSPLKTV